METNENQLIREVLGGNADAFTALVKQYLTPVFNFVYRLVNDREAAEDVTQETFVKAWKHLGRFDRDKNFKTWLYTIAKRTAFDYFKKKKTVPFSFFEDEDGNSFLDQAADEQSIEKLLEQKDAAATLEKALDKLPKHYQFILTLHYKDDLSLQEIAEILGESYNTIKSRHVRGLAKLKEIFSDSSA